MDPQERLRAGWARQALLLLVTGAGGLALLFRTIVTAWSARDPTPSWLRGDLDTTLIHGGLLKVHSLADTLTWWSGPWVGQVPFYRPLTSYVFWLEWQLFGDREWLYLIPAVTFHIGACLCFCFMLHRLAKTERWPQPALAALVGAYGFVGAPYPSSNRLEVVTPVALLWKNQPDSLAAICVCLSIVCYLAARKRAGLPWSAAGWYVAGCLFKEIAFPLPVVCLLLEPELRRREAIRRLLLMGGIGAICLILRQLALGGIGYTYGSNAGWWARTLVHLGPLANAAVSGEWLGPAQALWALGLGCALVCGRRLRRGTAHVAAACIALALTVGWLLMGALYIAASAAPADFRDPSTWASGLLLVVQPSITDAALATALWVGACGLVYFHHRRTLGLAFVWTLAFLAPLTLSPGPAHRYYLPDAGFMLLDGCAAAFLAHRVLEWIKVRLAEPRSSPPWQSDQAAANQSGDR